MTTTSTLAIRELDHRRRDGIDVRLLWNSRTNQVSVVVEDKNFGETFVLDVPGSDALEAFNHPHAYSQLGRFDALVA